MNEPEPRADGVPGGGTLGRRGGDTPGGPAPGGSGGGLPGDPGGAAGGPASASAPDRSGRAAPGASAGGSAGGSAGRAARHPTSRRPGGSKGGESGPAVGRAADRTDARPPHAGAGPGESPGPPVPAYGSGSLADLGPSVLAALGVPGEADVLGLPALPRACVLLVDGLGWELLRAHAATAPYLASLPGRALTAGFPTTTATSLASLGTGRPPGGHGMVGYQVAVPGEGRLLNCLRWADGVDPRRWQPAATVYERAAAAGVQVAHVAARAFEHSGLTRAVYRGAGYRAADSLGALVARAEAAIREGERSYVTVYHGDLDATGHVFGCRSAAWREHLAFVDLLARRLAEAMPPDAALYVTADHGMVDPAERIDVDAEPALRAGVALLGGEARARHVYAEPGAAGDVLSAWRQYLSGRAWVLTRDEAIDAGLFGPVEPSLAARIGDVVAVPRADLAIVATRAEPVESSLVGMHGALLPDERLVPLLSRVPNA